MHDNPAQTDSRPFHLSLFLPHQNPPLSTLPIQRLFPLLILSNRSMSAPSYSRTVLPPGHSHDSRLDLCRTIPSKGYIPRLSSSPIDKPTPPTPNLGPACYNVNNHHLIRRQPLRQTVSSPPTHETGFIYTTLGRDSCAPIESLSRALRHSHSHANGRIRP